MGDGTAAEILFGDLAFILRLSFGFSIYRLKWLFRCLQTPTWCWFCELYAAAQLSLMPPRAQPCLCAHLLQQVENAIGPVLYYAFRYPPIFLLIITPLALLPYLGALAIWTLSTGGGAMTLSMRHLVSSSKFPLLLFFASPSSIFKFIKRTKWFLNCRPLLSLWPGLTWALTSISGLALGYRFISRTCTCLAFYIAYEASTELLLFPFSQCFFNAALVRSHFLVKKFGPFSFHRGL